MFNHHSSPQVHDIMHRLNEAELARREVRQSLIRAAREFEAPRVESRAKARPSWFRLRGLRLSPR
jgi:hypothetical protein